jgi:hypothetical protein
VNTARARRWYLSGLFVLLLSNGISAMVAAIGIRGLAFYHVQALLLVVCGVQFCVVLLGGGMHRTIDSTLFGLLLASLLYSIASALFLLRFGDIVPAYVALMIHTVSFYPATALLMVGCARLHDEMGEQGIPRWIVWGAVAVLLFGWLQFVVGDPIVEVANSDNVSKLVASKVLGTFRPPSVFESSFQFGLFSVLVFCLAASKAMFAGGKLAWILAILAVSGVALSQTRNVFLCGACCAASLFLLVRKRKRGGGSRLLKCAPFAYMLSAIALMVYAVISFLSSDMAKTGDLADTSSTWARVSSWQQAWQNLVLRGSVFDSLFGFGITQAGQASDYRSLYPARAEGLFIDSTLVNLFLLQGVVGLVIFLWLWWLVWKRLLRKTEETWEPLTIGVTIFYSTFLAAGVFNILNGQWWGITLSLSLLVLSRPQARAKSRILCAA